MKKLLQIVLLGCTIFTGVFSKDMSMEKIKNKGELVVGLDDTFAPMGFRDSKGELVGFDIDLAKEVTKRMGVKVVFQPCDWDGVLFDLRSGKIDAIWNGLTVTETREKQISFSESYFDDSQIILVKNKEIKNISDLYGKNIGLQMGSTAYFALENSSFSKKIKDVKKYPTNVEALLDLKSGRVDGVVMDSVVAKYYLVKDPQFRILPQALANEKIAVGLRKNDESLKKEIDLALDDIKKDGTFDKIYKKWFGNN